MNHINVPIFELKKHDYSGIKPSYRTPIELMRDIKDPFYLIGGETKIDAIKVRASKNGDEIDAILIFDENSLHRPFGDRDIYDMKLLESNLFNVVGHSYSENLRKDIEVGTSKYVRYHLEDPTKDLVTIHKVDGNFAAQRNKILNGKIERKWYKTQRIANMEDFLKNKVKQVV
ncbi:MAG: hypothetical protein J7K87_04465 [Candidatus Aenigmarchaeota archaeon]|nr:hypothetical protein [Candidatus Aenigmarchaeota archaeon]